MAPLEMLEELIAGEIPRYRLTKLFRRTTPNAPRKHAPPRPPRWASRVKRLGRRAQLRAEEAWDFAQWEAVEAA